MSDMTYTGNDDDFWEQWEKMTLHDQGMWALQHVLIAYVNKERDKERPVKLNHAVAVALGDLLDELRASVPVLETPPEALSEADAPTPFEDVLSDEEQQRGLDFLRALETSPAKLVDKAAEIAELKAQLRDAQRTLDIMRQESLQADRYNSEREGELLAEIESLRGALVEPVPAPTGIDPSELMRALHANLTPLAHVEVTDRRPYGMSEDTIQVWPITGVRSVVNHLALKSAPVPAPRLKCDHTTEFYDEAGDATRVLWSEDVIGYNYCPDCGTLLLAPPVGTQE